MPSFWIPGGIVYGSGGSSLFAACRVLFGPEVNLSEEFLDYLQHGGVKTAFRQKAKETHPDAISQPVICTGGGNADRFRKVAEAYKLLTVYIEERERSPIKAKRRCATSADNEIKRYHAPISEQYYYQGCIPARPLQLGRYLYYRGVISYQTLVTAIVWQKRTRPTLGRLAMEAGWLTGKDVNAIESSRLTGRFGERAVRMGLLKPIQLSTLLLRQQALNRRIGDYFVDCADLSRRDLERLVMEMQRHNMRFNKGY